MELMYSQRTVVILEDNLSYLQYFFSITEVTLSCLNGAVCSNCSLPYINLEILPLVQCM